MSHRLHRVNELLKREISTVLQKDLVFTPALVTVNWVEVTNDLKEAKVYVGILGGEPREVLDKLRRQRGGIQHKIARRITLRQTPVLSFVYDDSARRGVDIINLLDEVDKLPKAPPLEEGLIEDGGSSPPIE